jgi:formate dehydrogenase maturation protein FdhE
MQCPICGSFEQNTLEMHAGQFTEGLVECSVCNSSWSVNHGHAELVVDAQISSFLEGQSECVEAGDYTWAA